MSDVQNNEEAGGNTAATAIGSSGEIVFDTASGFSVEEQQEILNRINSIAAENRIAPPEGVLKAEAKKRGILFPVLVNAAALLLLVGGFFLLWFFHGQDDESIRENSAVLGLAERRLIQEIRQETNRQLAEKENEINGIRSRLAETGNEYRELLASVETLTEEQEERAEYLLRMQEEYQSTLAGLEEERTRILEESRAREASLRAQAEERIRALSSQIEQSQANLTAAMEELRRLSTEQERAAAAEAQLGGYYVSVGSLIKTGRFADASSALESMRSFLNAPLVQGMRSLESRRQIHLAAVVSLEEAVAEARRLEEAAVLRPEPVNDADSVDSAVAAELEAKNAELEETIASLEQKIADQERTLAAYSASGTELNNVIGEYEKHIGELQTAQASQQQSLNQKDAAIQTLHAEAAAREEHIAEQEQQITSLHTQVQETARTAEENRSHAAQLQTENENLTRTNSELRTQIEAVRQLLLNQQ
jgi:chromosome segregation ATPase